METVKQKDYKVRKNYFAFFGRQFLLIILTLISLYPLFFMLITAINLAFQNLLHGIILLKFLLVKILASGL